MATTFSYFPSYLGYEGNQTPNQRVEFAMDKHTDDAAKALSEARRKNAAAALSARYAELDRLTGTTLEERVKELITKNNARK